MTTTVTIELDDRQVALTRNLAAWHSRIPEDSEVIGGLLAVKVADALPDPDEDLINELLTAYCEAASLPGSVRKGLNSRMAKGMKAVLDLIRERDARE